MTAVLILVYSMRGESFVANYSFNTLGLCNKQKAAIVRQYRHSGFRVVSSGCHKK